MTAVLLYLYVLLLLYFTVSVRCDHRQRPVTTKLHENQDMCPAVVCGYEGAIPEECRRPQFTIGQDGQTLCKICDESFCGRKQDVCDRLMCPNDKHLKPYCRKPNYVIGSDGITRCRVCDTNACDKHKDICPSVHCPRADKIKRKCRIKQYTIGRDGVTKCRVCDKDACRGSRTGIHNKLVEYHHH